MVLSINIFKFFSNDSNREKKRFMDSYRTFSLITYANKIVFKKACRAFETFSGTISNFSDSYRIEIEPETFGTCSLE